MIDARKKADLYRKNFLKKHGIKQADISKLERRNKNLSFRTLKRLAVGMGRTPKVEFIRR